MKIPWLMNIPRVAPVRRQSAALRGFTIIEATVAISLAAFTAVIATQLMVSAQRGHRFQTQQTQALRELDNALEMAFWLDASQLENATLEAVARSTIETAQEAGTAPDELAITLTVTDDPSMSPQTKRIDGAASYREQGSGSIVTLPTLSIWRTITSPAAQTAKEPAIGQEATP